MITFTQQQKLTAYRAASPAKKNAAFSEAIMTAVEGVIRKHRLTPQQGKDFQYLVGAYIVDLVSKDSMLENIDDVSVRQDTLVEILPIIDRVIAEYKPEVEEVEEGETEPEEAPKVEEVIAPIKVSTPAPSVSKPTPSVPANLPTEAAPHVSDIPTGAPMPTIPALNVMPTSAQDTPEQHPERTAFLQDVEKTMNPIAPEIKPVAPAVPKPQNSVDERLQSLVFTPREEKKIVVETAKVAPKIPPVPAPNTKIPTPYKGNDPYRELPE